MSRSTNTKIGTIIEELSNCRFKIKVVDGTTVQGYLAGKMKLHRIRVSIGDRVEFVVDTIGINNRIMRRL